MKQDLIYVHGHPIVLVSDPSLSRTKLMTTMLQLMCLAYDGTL